MFILQIFLKVNKSTYAYGGRHWIEWRHYKNRWIRNTVALALVPCRCSYVWREFITTTSTILSKPRGYLCTSYLFYLSLSSHLGALAGDVSCFPLDGEAYPHCLIGQPWPLLFLGHIEYSEFASIWYCSHSPRSCLVPQKFCKIFHILRHIESLDVCMEY